MTSEDTKTRADVSLSDVLEQFALNPCHWHVIVFACLVWTLTGWGATCMTYMLDAAMVEDGAWATLTTQKEILTISDMCIILCVSGVSAVFGNVFLGYLSDRLGRIVCLGIVIGLCLVSSVGFALSRSKVLLMGFVALNPFIRDGAAMISGSLLAEWLPSAWRGSFLTALHCFWNIGRFALTLLWVAVPPEQYWTTFFLLAALFPLAMLLFVLVRGSSFESPRWLLVSGNTDGCIRQLKCLMSASTIPGVVPEGWDDPRKLHLPSQSSSQQDLWSIRELRYLAVLSGAVLFSLCFASQIMFAWLTEYLIQIGADGAITACNLACPLAKIGTALVLIAGGPDSCLIDRCSRVRFLKLGLFGYGICLILLVLVRNNHAIISVVFFSQVSEEMIWIASGLYLNEAFPTSLRSYAFGVSMGLANLGGIMANICAVFVDNKAWIPIVITIHLLFISFFGCFWLEENQSNQKLTDFYAKAPKYGACD